MRAAARNASRRRFIGVEPECAAWPWNVIAWRSTPNAEVEQHRTLFDVQLEIRHRVHELAAAVLHLLEIDADGLQRFGQRDARLVDERAGLVHVEVARARR
jgi:hypothetical protein